MNQEILKEFGRVRKYEPGEEPPEAEVVGVQFGLMSADTIRSLSAVEVKSSATFKAGVIQRGGPTDERLGTCSRRDPCGTCTSDYLGCPLGHSGHIELAAPVPNGEALSEVQKIAGSVCYRCCRLLIPKDFLNYDNLIQDPKGRLSRIYKACRRREFCETHAKSKYRRKIQARATKSGETYEEEAAKEPFEDDNVNMDELTVEELLERDDLGCGARPPEWIKENDVIIRPVFDLTPEDVEAYKNGNKDVIPVVTPDDLLDIFKNIPDDVVRLFGFDPEHSHCSSLIWSCLYVLPMPARPNGAGRSGQKAVSEDDLTIRYKNIEKLNLKLAEYMKKHGQVNLCKYRFDGEMYNSMEDLIARTVKKPSELFDRYDKLYRSVITFQDAKLKGKDCKSYGKDRESIKHRFRGRKANRLHAHVTGKRISHVARTVVGLDVYMDVDQVGVPLPILMKCTYPERVTEFNIHRLTTMVRNGPHKYPGAAYVIFKDETMEDLANESRRSTLVLHKGMTVERHLIQDDIVLMNRQPSLHKMSMMAHRVNVILKEIYTHRIHGSVTSPYNADFDGDEMNMHILQSPDTRAEAMECMSVASNLLKDDSPIVQYVQNPVIGAYLLTHEKMMLRKDQIIQMLMHARYWDGVTVPWDRPCGMTSNGERLYSGRDAFSCLFPRHMELKKDDIHISNGRLIAGQFKKATLNKSGGLIHIICRDYGRPYAVKFISASCRFLSWFLTCINNTTVSVRDCYVPQDVLGIKELKMHATNYVRSLPKKLSAIQERNVCMLLDRVRDIVSHRAQEYFKGSVNGVSDVILSGAKGNAMNRDQISGAIGAQRNHKSERFPHTTSHYAHPGADQTAGRGMIYNNFTLGMDPVESFFHQASSRGGLVDTACKTAETGYMQRRLSKLLESVRINLYQQVVTVDGMILQRLYGNDRFDTTEMERAYIPQDVKSAIWTDSVLPLMLNHCRDAQTLYAVNTPLHMERYLIRVRNMYPDGPVVNPAPWVDKLMWLVGRWCHDKLRVYFYYYFERLQGYTARQLDALYDQLELNILKAIIPNGHMIGQQVAQSIGEPLTQTTLNTFHLSGEENPLTSGVPRAEEIINAVRKPKTPSMDIYFEPACETKEEAKAKGLEMLQRVLGFFMVFHERNPRLDYDAVTIVEDDDMVVDEEEEDEEQQKQRAVPVPLAIFEDEEPPDEKGSDSDNDEPADEDDESDGENQSDTSSVHATEEEEAEEEPNLSEDEQESEDNVEVVVVVQEEPAPTIDEDMWKRIQNDARYLTVVLHLKEELDPSTVIPLLKGVFKAKMTWFYGVYCIGFISTVNDPAWSSWVTSMGMSGFNLNLLEDLIIKRLCRVVVKGIKGIMDFAVCKTQLPVKVEQQIDWKDVYYVKTKGVNLKAVLQQPCVNIEYTRSNDIREVEAVLGVDAAAFSISNELSLVMSTSGVSVRRRYLEICALCMTSSGEILPATYVGICQSSSSLIRNASFESTLDTFKNGSFRGEYDPCLGRTESIVVARRFQGGTGLVRTVNLPVTAPPISPLVRLKYPRPQLVPPSQQWLDKLKSPAKATAPLRLAGPVFQIKTSASRRKTKAMSGRMSLGKQVVREPKPRRPPAPRVATKSISVGICYTRPNQAFVPFESITKVYYSENGCFVPFE